MLCVLASTRTAHSPNAPLPSVEIHLTVAVPTVRPRTFPLASTVATDGSEDSHSTFCTDASSGEMTGAIFCVDPVHRISSAEMLICETACSTVISQLTGVEKPLPSDIAEMRHVPAPTALTLPLASTIATLSSEEIHVAPWKYAFSGCTVYDNAAAAFSLPAPRSKVSLLSERAALSTPATTLY